MLIVNLKYLGRQIYTARTDCHLTQKELAAETKLSTKTIQDIERGVKNPSYDTLARLVLRLGIPVNALFQIEATAADNDDESHYFISKFQACNRKNQEILLAILNFLLDLLLKEQYESENSR